MTVQPYSPQFSFRKMRSFGFSLYSFANAETDLPQDFNFEAKIVL